MPGENPPGYRSASPPLQLCVLSVPVLGPGGARVHCPGGGHIQLLVCFQRPPVHCGLWQYQGGDRLQSLRMRPTDEALDWTVCPGFLSSGAVRSNIRGPAGVSVRRRGGCWSLRPQAGKPSQEPGTVGPGGDSSQDQVPQREVCSQTLPTQTDSKLSSDRTQEKSLFIYKYQRMSDIGKVIFNI